MLLDDDNGIEESTWNLTSMTDLVFLLLVFFLCATTFLDPERALDLELPAAQHAERHDEAPDEIVINVLRNGEITLAGRPLPAAALEAELRRSARRDPNVPVTIRGDRLVHHEAIVGVMDACSAAGLRNLSVGTLEG